MRIGFVELLLILLIASLTIGPSAALWVDRWLRRANRASKPFPPGRAPPLHAAGPCRRPSVPPSGRKCSRGSRN